jgi:hypothetical protein
MPRPLRSDIYRRQEIDILHCCKRWVRLAQLSDGDSVSCADYSYRKERIRQRIETLASVFGIDVLAHAVTSKHLHVILRYQMSLPLGPIDKLRCVGCRFSQGNGPMNS